MSSQLQENLNLILEEKNTKLLPENLKAGITCLGVTGILEVGNNPPATGELEITENGVYDVTTYASVKVNIPTIVLDKIEITQVGKTQYLEDEKFDFSGYKVLATYSNTTTRDVTDMCTFEPSGELTLTDTTVTISYTENNITKTAEQFIIVDERVYEYEEFSSRIIPTSWTSVNGGEYYIASNAYGEWIASANNGAGTNYNASAALDTKTDNTGVEINSGNGNNCILTVECPVHIKPTAASCRYLGTESTSYLEALNANTKEWERIEGDIQSVSSGNYIKTTNFTFGESYYRTFRLNCFPRSGTDSVRLFDFNVSAGTVRKW